ncbi:YhhA family cyclophane-containing RiPP [Methylobacterium iners]|uniref:Transposase n=1 Tax=Methylobacterium iners TaxID=418707 RepID=A0ABQ4S5C9_9HYPH|nr:hypothetical protein OCOJLMKI_4917 [Methylobacterium iners]
MEAAKRLDDSVAIEVEEDGRDNVVLESAVLERLLLEVQNEEPAAPHAYNRMHNRHNR